MAKSNKMMNYIIDLIGAVSAKGKSRDGEPNPDMRIEVKCTSGGKETVSVDGAACVFAVMDEDGVHIGIFGDMSPKDIMLTASSILCEIGKIDVYEMSGEKMVDSVIEMVLLKRVIGALGEGE